MDIVTYALSKKYTDNAILGTTGPLAGQSAYQIAQLYGYTGSEAQFAADQQGHPPFIIDATTTPAAVVGNWAIWDSITTHGYIDSGVAAQGPPGADGVYTYQQNTAVTIWTVPHNLNSINVLVQVIDNAGNEVIPDIAFTSANAVTLTFAHATLGTAIIRK
jgi:hypothetical protein